MLSLFKHALSRESWEYAMASVSEQLGMPEIRPDQWMVWLVKQGHAKLFYGR